jgi:hypothetical protein
MVVAQDANQRLDRLAVADPDRAAEMRRLMAGEMPRREAQLARFSPRAPVLPHRVSGKFSLENRDTIIWWARTSYLIKHVQGCEAKDLAKLVARGLVDGPNLDVGFLDRHKIPPKRRRFTAAAV